MPACESGVSSIAPFRDETVTGPGKHTDGQEYRRVLKQVMAGGEGEEGQEVVGLAFVADGESAGDHGNVDTRLSALAYRDRRALVATVSALDRTVPLEWGLAVLLSGWTRFVPAVVDWPEPTSGVRGGQGRRTRGRRSGDGECAARDSRDHRGMAVVHQAPPGDGLGSRICAQSESPPLRTPRGYAAHAAARSDAGRRPAGANA